MEPSHLTFQGAPVDDYDTLNKLPSGLRALLEQINGFIQFGGGLHIRGACTSPAWHSLHEVWHGSLALWKLYPALAEDGIPFGQDALGNQFLLRNEVVHRLSGETGELDSLNCGLFEFLDQAQADAVGYLSLHPLLQFQDEGGILQPGELLNVYRPLCMRKASSPLHLVAVPVSERIAFLVEIASMDNHTIYDADAAYDAWVNKAWRQERGIFHTSYNNSLVPVRAPVEDVAQFFAEDYEGAKWHRDVLGQHLMLGKEGLFIFRLQGHSWTEVVYEYNPYKPRYTLKRGYAQALSRHLNVRVISYYVGDTSGVIGYTLYEAGETSERFDWMEGGWDEDTLREMQNAPAEMRDIFYSKIRQVDESELKDAYGFVERFFIDQDAFEPGITPGYFLVGYDGQWVKAHNPGFLTAFGGREAVSAPEFERVDYVALA